MAEPKTAKTASHSAEKVLRGAKLRVTPARMQVLEAFLGQPHALPHSALEQLAPECDRVTLYRTLSTFTEHGIVHKVPDDEGVTKYALCSQECSDEHHHDDHVHFKCLACGATVCLEGTALPAVVLPKGYHLQDASLLVQGTCPDCS